MWAMKNRNTKKRQKRRGRPPTGKALGMFPLRLSEETLAAVDAWIRDQGEGMSRSEALRRLIDIGLEQERKGD
jgi:hypothetical protein